MVVFCHPSDVLSCSLPTRSGEQLLLRWNVRRGYPRIFPRPFQCAGGIRDGCDENGRHGTPVAAFSASCPALPVPLLHVGHAHFAPLEEDRRARFRLHRPPSPGQDSRNQPMARASSQSSPKIPVAIKTMVSSGRHDWHTWKRFWGAMLPTVLPATGRG
jgi:hypothetical protein